MLRLRSTVFLSALVLAGGVAGTAWLSGRSADQPLWFSMADARTVKSLTAGGPAHWTAQRFHSHATRHHHAISAARAADGADQARPEDQQAVTAPTPELVPLSMPVDADTAYEKQRGHLDGLVLMHVTIDAAGHVNAASIAESSGDAALDAHALRSVRQWRFAVPPDHASGFSADLPMRFSSQDEPLASAH